MIRAFLFDIGNVIVRFDFSRAIRALAGLGGVADETAALRLLDAAKLRYEDGQISRADFLREAFALLRYRGTEAQFVAAWQDIFWPNDPMFSLVRRLHGEFPLFLLSNTNDMHVEGLFRDFDLFRLFTGATYSHLARASKPRRAIYDLACRQHGLDPRTTFFIDDLAANIATANELQFQTHHYHHERHDALTAALASAGVRA
jgi:putative hydrolase of the HAD superfamily